MADYANQPWVKAGKYLEEDLTATEGSYVEILLPNMHDSNIEFVRELTHPLGCMPEAWVYRVWLHGKPNELQIKPKPFQVYFIYNGEGAVKIGVARDPEKRRKELQTGSPSKLSVIHTMLGGRPKEAELHRMFSEDRLSGEWFQLTESMLQFLNEDKIDEG